MLNFLHHFVCPSNDQVVRWVEIYSFPKNKNVRLEIFRWIFLRISNFSSKYVLSSSCCYAWEFILRMKIKKQESFQKFLQYCYNFHHLILMLFKIQLDKFQITKTYTFNMILIPFDMTFKYIYPFSYSTLSILPDMTHNKKII